MASAVTCRRSRGAVPAAGTAGSARSMPLGLGPQVPHRPGGTAGGHSSHGPFGQILKIRRRRNRRDGLSRGTGGDRPHQLRDRARPERARSVPPATRPACRPGSGAASCPAGCRGWPAGRAGRHAPASGSCPCAARYSRTSSAYRASIAARRREKNSIIASGTPVISRTGSRPPAVSGRAVNVTPSDADSARLERGVVRLRRRDRHPVQRRGRPAPATSRRCPGPWTRRRRGCAGWGRRRGSPSARTPPRSARSSRPGRCRRARSW